MNSILMIKQATLISEKFMNTTPTVLIVGKPTKLLHTLIENHCPFYMLNEQADTQAFLIEHGKNITAVVTSAAYGLTAELMRQLPNLKIAVSFGVGFDTLDIGYAQAHDICVTNTPNVLNDCVADLAIGLMIDVARNISSSDRFIRQGEQQWRTKLGVQVSHKTLGIIGLGNIGKAIAKRATAFDMKIAYYGRHPQKKITYTYYNELKALAHAVDFLIVALPATVDTKHLINQEILHALGGKGILINIARGSIVDEKALVKALQEKTIAGAGLDVFEHEPNTPPALWVLDNVVMTSHIGSATHETRDAMSKLVFANLKSFLEGNGAITPIN